MTREQQIQLTTLPDDLVLIDVRVADGGLIASWSTEEESRFDPGWPRAYAVGAPDDPAELSAQTVWQAELAGSLPRLDGLQLLQDPRSR